MTRAKTKQVDIRSSAAEYLTYVSSTGAGVFKGKQAVHIVPPADRVPYLIKDLFD